MGFNSAFKGLKLLKKPRERAFKQFKLPRPQCVKNMKPGVFRISVAGVTFNISFFFNAYTCLFARYTW